MNSKVATCLIQKSKQQDPSEECICLRLVLFNLFSPYNRKHLIKVHDEGESVKTTLWIDGNKRNGRDTSNYGWR